MHISLRICCRICYKTIFFWKMSTLFWKRAVQDIHCISCILYNIHISERSVNQFMKTMLTQQSVGLHFKEKEIETFEKSWNALICIKSARQLLLAQLKQDNDYHGISLLILWPLKLTLAASSSVSWKLVDSPKRCTWQKKAKLSTENESNQGHC